MSIKADASLNFLKLPGADKVIAGKSIHNCLVAKPDKFINLPVPAATLLATTDLLGVSELNARNGDKASQERLKAVSKIWNNQYRSTANYISLLAEGDVQVIMEAGFTPTKTTRQKSAKIVAIDGFAAVVDPAKGTATAQCNTAKGAKGYVYITAPESVNMTMKGDDLVIDVNGVLVYVKAATQSRATLTGLASGQKVCISMYAFNTAGSSTLTEEQSVIPQ